MTDRLAITILILVIIGYVATLTKTVDKVVTLESINKDTCCMKIPYIYRGRVDTVCYNPTDTTYNFVEQEIIRQWEQQ